MKRKIDLIFIIIASIFGGMIGYNETDIFAKPERKTSATEISEVKLPVLFDPVGKFQLNVDMNKQHIAFTGDNIEIEGKTPAITVTIIPPAKVINPVKKEVVEVPVKYYMPLSQMPVKRALLTVKATSKPDMFNGHE